VYEETLTGQPHDTSAQKATSDNENVDECGCSLTSCPGKQQGYILDAGSVRNIDIMEQS